MAICFACAAAGVATAVLCARPHGARRTRSGPAQGAQESWLDDLQMKFAKPWRASNVTPPECGPVWRNYTIYTNEHLDILPTSEVATWEECCSACGNNTNCTIWSFGKDAETSQLQDGCYLKALDTADPTDTDQCPSFIHIPGIYSGTTTYAITNKKIAGIGRCSEKNSTTTATTTIEPTSDLGGAAAGFADLPQASYTETTMTTTALTTTTSSTLLGSPATTTSQPFLGSISEYLKPPKLLWLLLAMLVVLLLCLACALALANTGHHKSSRSASIASPKKEEHHSVPQPESWMPAPTQMVAQGPMIPVTQRLPEPPPNLEDTYAKGFIDGMVQWVRENNPSPQYTPTAQPGAMTVAGLPTATGVQQAAGMGSWQQGGLQQGGLQHGDWQSVQQTASLSPGAGSFQAQQAQPGVGSFPAQGNSPSARSFRQFPFPQAPVSGGASFNLPQPEPGSFVAATHR